MDEIIKVNYDSEEPTVSARDLYDSLSSEEGAKGTERFSKWFERYCGYGFEEGEDYSNPYQKVRVQKEGNREVQREVEDYDLSVDMAKQVCMLQKTERGKRVRQYLIDLDKVWNTPEQVMARALKMADKTIDKLKNDNAGLLEDVSRMRPKEVFADAVATSHTSILIGDLAKILKQNGYETGQRRLFAWLRDNEYLIKREGSDRNMPTQKSMEMGLFEIKESTVSNPDGSVRINRTTKVTGKGQQYFINKFLAKSEKPCIN
ncbi:MAG: oxidoreductase [Lachnospiraceae bacterium]|nr:oxidoreductase [Lachnospiraceae bacterium]